jgi:hypothetical protein
MHINFQDLVESRHLTADELNKEKIELLKELIDEDFDLALVQRIHHLIDDAERSGYHGGYNDAHWYAKGVGDGA